MALIIKDRIKETTTSTGTGAISLAGSSATFDTFASVMSNSDTCYYAIVHATGGTDEWEVGLATYASSGNTLTRTTVISGSNGASAVNFGSGVKDVFITIPASKTINRDASGDVDFGAQKILYANVYSAEGDLPAAGTYHGMFAHVHGTARAYYSHAGNWIKLVQEDSSGNIAVSGTVDGRDVAADGTKLDGVEASATADQTAAEIRALVESASDSNVFTDADHTKLNGIEASATADQTDAEIRAAVEAASDSNVFTDADHTKLNGIETSADVTDTANVVAALTAGTNIAIANDGTITATDTDTNTTYSAGSGLDLSGTTFSHTDTSSQSSVNGSGRTYIQDITLDTYGHVTGIATATETVTNTDTNTTYSAGNGLSLSGTQFLMSGSYSGNFTASGNVTAYSDERLKDNIDTITGGLDKVLKMRGVMYDKDGKRETGVIAQEIREVLPEAVHDDGEYLSVAYGNLVGVLIESIKDLKREIRELHDGAHNMVQQIEELKSGSNK